MGKRKSKKQTNFIVSIIIMVLSVLAICTLFMPLFTTTSSTFLTAESYSPISGADAIKALFNSEASSDFSFGANALISLKASEENGFVGFMLCLAYFLTVIASAGILAFRVLSIVGIKFNFIEKIVSVVAVLFALVTIIFAFIACDKFGSVDLGSIASVKTAVSVGAYMLISAIAAGVYNAYKLSK